MEKEQTVLLSEIDGYRIAIASVTVAAAVLKTTNPEMTNGSYCLAAAYQLRKETGKLFDEEFKRKCSSSASECHLVFIDKHQFPRSDIFDHSAVRIPIRDTRFTA